MRNEKRLMAVAALAVAACLFMTAGISAGTSFLAVKKAAALPTQTSRRIWAVDNTTGGWFYEQHIYVHLNAANSDVEMSRALEDYYGGLFYCDITANETGILFRREISNWTYPYNQTLDVAVASDSDVYYIDQNTNDGKFPVSKGTAGMSNAQLAVVLHNYYSCTESYTSGYLAYPAINAAFYAPSGDSGKDDTIVNDPAGGTTTIGNKVAMMGAMYHKAIA